MRECQSRAHCFAGRTHDSGGRKHTDNLHVRLSMAWGAPTWMVRTRIRGQLAWMDDLFRIGFYLAYRLEILHITTLPIDWCFNCVTLLTSLPTYHMETVKEKFQVRSNTFYFCSGFVVQVPSVSISLESVPGNSSARCTPNCHLHAPWPTCALRYTKDENNSLLVALVEYVYAYSVQYFEH